MPAGAVLEVASRVVETTASTPLMARLRLALGSNLELWRGGGEGHTNLTSCTY